MATKVRPSTFKKAQEVDADGNRLHPHCLTLIMNQYEDAVHKVAHKYIHIWKYRGCEYDDLVQMARELMITTINKFDPSKAKFITYYMSSAHSAFNGKWGGYASEADVNFNFINVPDFAMDYDDYSGSSHIDLPLDKVTTGIMDDAELLKFLDFIDYDELLPEEKELLVLRHFYEKNFREIGEYLGVTRQSAQGRIKRIEKKLGNLLGSPDKS